MTVNLKLTFLDKDLLAFSEYLSKNHFDNAILDCDFSFCDFSCECRIIANDIYILNKGLNTCLNEKTNK